MFNLARRLQKVTKYIEPNISIIGLVGALGFPSYYIVWQYFIPQAYENLTLRIIGMFLFIPLTLFSILPTKFKENFHWYFFISATYAMPFFFSFMLIKNNFSFIWHMSTIASIFLLIITAYDWLLIIVMTLFGFFLACMSVWFCDGVINFSSFKVEAVPVYLFSLFGGLLFNYRNEISNTARLSIMKSMAGSISHELRNPINAINFAASELKSISAKVENNEVKKEIEYLDSVISDSILQANNIINIILADLSEKKISDSEFSILHASNIIPKIVANFPYSNKSERDKVKVLIRKDFDEEKDSDIIFKAIVNRLTFIIYNLLKNALYYISQYPNSTITVGTESLTIKRKKWNAIYVYDTGPGIDKKVISKLFDDFFTSGKKGGTGLGLSFCKRNMELFGGKIICESHLGNSEEKGWTKFSLLFPKLSKEEIKKFEQISESKNEALNPANTGQQNIKPKLNHDKNSNIYQDKDLNEYKVLIVDDEKANLMIGKSKIQKFLPNIVCHTAESGELAIKMARETKYQLILMDIQMPVVSGVEATKIIRAFLPKIPIIAYTSLDYNQFLLEVIDNSFSQKKSNNAVKNLGNFSDYIHKPGKLSFFCRSLSKWLTDYQDQFLYLENNSETEISRVLNNKKILLADDQEMNLRLTKKMLEKVGAEVVTANDGRQLIEVYQASLSKVKSADKEMGDEALESSFDAIVTDINMPLIKGDDAAKKIREIEKINHVKHQNRIPIVALSGDGDREAIYHFFSCKIDDYFTKGSDPKILLKILATAIIGR